MPSQMIYLCACSKFGVVVLYACTRYTIGLMLGQNMTVNGVTTFIKVPNIIVCTLLSQFSRASVYHSATALDFHEDEDIG